jgi:hypothetical protein
MSSPAFEPDHRASAGAYQADRWRGVHPAPPVAQVVSTAPPLVANDFLFFVVDERSGKLAATSRVAGLGCAAALLSELVLAGSLVVTQGQTLLTRQVSHLDQAAGEVWREIAANPQHRDTRTWLEFFAPTAVERVAGRTATAGLVFVKSRRTLAGRRVPVYLPADARVGGFPTGRVQRLLSGQGRTGTVADHVLAGLCDATGAIDRVLWDPAMARQARARLARIVQGLHPYLRDLTATTRAAVGDAVLARR